MRTGQLRKMDYSVDPSVVIKNLSLHEVCQRCGEKSETGLCPTCSANDTANIPFRPATLYDGMIKIARNTGRDVYVNGKFDSRQQTIRLAEMMVTVMNRRFAPKNATVRATYLHGAAALTLK